MTTGDTAGSFTSKIQVRLSGRRPGTRSGCPEGLRPRHSRGRRVHRNEHDVDAYLGPSALQLKIQKVAIPSRSTKADGTTLIAQGTIRPRSERQWASDGAGTVTKIRDEWSAPTGQRFEGYGERYDTLDQRGRDVANYVYNQYRDQGPNHRTYLSAPFYTSSAGYGSTSTARGSRPSMSAPYAPTWRGSPADTGGAGTSTLDYYLFTGTGQHLDAYTATTARPQLPQKWAFGLWMSASRWNTQAEVNAELANVTANSIPTSAMVLEQWSDGLPFYLWHGATYTPVAGGAALHYSDLAFPPAGWADPKAMVTSAHNQGIKVVLWQIPVLKQNFDANPSTAPQQHINDRDYAIAQGYVVGNGSSGAYRIPTGQWFGDSTVPDFTKPAATTWWMSKRAYLFDDVGIDGLKTDGSEAIFGRDLTFGDGRVGAQMHNAYRTPTPRPTTRSSRRNRRERCRLRAPEPRAPRPTESSGPVTSPRPSPRSSRRCVPGSVLVSRACRSGPGTWPGSQATSPAASSTFDPRQLQPSCRSCSTTRRSQPVPLRGADPVERPGAQWRQHRRAHLPQVRQHPDEPHPHLYTEAKNSSTTGAPMMQAMDWAYRATRPRPAWTSNISSAASCSSLRSRPRERRPGRLPSVRRLVRLLDRHLRDRRGTQHVAAGLDTIPVYARGGAIIPLNLNADYQLGGTIGNSMTSYPNLVFRIYPRGRRATGTSTTRPASLAFTSSEAWNSHTETVSVPVMPTTSTLQVSSTRPTSVTRDGTALTEYSSVAMLSRPARAGTGTRHPSSPTSSFPRRRRPTRLSSAASTRRSLQFLPNSASKYTAGGTTSWPSSSTMTSSTSRPAPVLAQTRAHRWKQARRCSEGLPGPEHLHPVG